MRASKLEQLEQERRGKMKTTAQLKEEREQRLATMTEEEKQEFYQEEKEQKKQEWDKKQVHSSLVMNAIEVQVLALTFLDPHAPLVIDFFSRRPVAATVNL